MTDPGQAEQDELRVRLERVGERIRRAERRAGVPPGSVRLLAVSKRHPAAAIRAVARAGQQAFGENYLSEAEAKIRELADLDLEWHYIGPIQSNKTRGIASHFDWVHSVDRPKLVRRLNEQRPASRPALNCLIQIRIGDEKSKSGAAPEELATLAEAFAGCDRLRLRGLMCIPPPSPDESQQRAWFRQLADLFSSLSDPPAGWDTLSMGMSADLESAIAEGATIVRVGTDIFGPRDP
ncbi:MAG: YggS family pyridoxal phosphate-dependent enzyme [Xanthomonadales bacterium]|nr:YggS family pyridoxal phosphate-dependent enzyme [Xanthomonadales bacterium]